MKNDTLNNILGWIKDEKFEKIQVEETEKVTIINQLSLLAELLVRTKGLIAEDSELVGISKALQENLLSLQQEGFIKKSGCFTNR